MPWACDSARQMIPCRNRWGSLAGLSLNYPPTEWQVYLCFNECCFKALSSRVVCQIANTVPYSDHLLTPLEEYCFFCLFCEVCRKWSEVSDKNSMLALLAMALKGTVCLAETKPLMAMGGGHFRAERNLKNKSERPLFWEVRILF